MMNTTPEHAAPRSRGQIWLLIGVFFAPLLVAFLLYYGVEGWRPTGRTNHGELIQPPRAVPRVAMQSASGEALADDFMLRKWSLVFIGAGDCSMRCREALAHMRQVRLALNDDMPRVQRVFLVTDQCCDLDFLQREHPGLITAKAEGAAVEMLQAFPQPQAGDIYIVDPLGNAMMRYTADAPAKGLLEDMKKLLKLSHIG